MKTNTGAVLPSALMGIANDLMSGFNKTYNNNVLRSGIVVKSYDVSDDSNISKLVPEYDVVVIEQDGNRAITPITYKNCVAASSLGSIADFLEVRLRAQKNVKNKKTGGKDFSGQDGAIVLLLCLDGASEKPIIIGCLSHPNRKSKLVGKEKILSGEFNGLAISVADDGSANITFKGATDHDGKPVDTEQGNTTIDIEKDGSVQLKNKGSTVRVEKKGNFLLKNEGTTTVATKKNTTITTDENFSTTSKKDSSMKMSKYILEAQGSASMKAQSFDITGQSKVDLKGMMVSISGDSQVMIKGATVTISGQVFIGGAGGQPMLLPSTQFIGIGNLGAPVISTPIGPFTTTSFAV